MSDLISRKALLRQLEGIHAFLSHDDYVQEITNAPAIEQCEPAAWKFKSDGFIDITDNPDVINGKEIIQTYYTTPPQPQTVKDALGKAAMIVQAKIGHYYPTPLTDAVAEIRALIEKE